MSEFMRAVVLGGVFLLIFVGAEVIRRSVRPPVEGTRKFVHVAGGIVVLSFPWVLRSPWTVFGLAVVFGTLIWGTRRLGLLASVHGVERTSEGGIFYPLGVVLLFTVAHDQPVFYLTAALALVISDAAAALTGSMYGRAMYAVEGDRRSIEGSLVFFVVTFFAVHLPLLLMTDVPRDVSVVLALHVAFIVTMLEGVSLWGSDNLIIPLATYFLLERFTGEDVVVIGAHLLILLLCVSLLSALSLRTHLLKTSGVMAAGVFFYAVYLLGGAAWMGVPSVALVGLAAVRWMRRSRADLPDAQYQVLAIMFTSIVPIMLLVAHTVLPRLFVEPEWVFLASAFRAPFVGVLTGHLAIVAATQFRPFGPGHRAPPSLGLALALAAGSCALVLPAGLWFVNALSAQSFLVAGTIGSLALGLYCFGRTRPAWPAEAPWNMALQTLSTGAAALSVLPVHLWALAGFG